MSIREEYQLLFELGCDDLKLVEKNLNDKETLSVFSVA